MKTDKNFPLYLITFGFPHENLKQGYGKENLKLHKFPNDFRFLPCKAEQEGAEKRLKITGFTECIPVSTV
jgi:hypothetical protein